MYRVLVCVLLLGLSACIKTESSEGASNYDAPDTLTQVGEIVPILSINGEPFPDKAFEAGKKAQRIQQLEAAIGIYEASPDSLEAIIWYGRRLGYLGRYHEAIGVYSTGLEIFPESYKLLRHRGEAFITVRNFDQAKLDLERAAFYARPFEDETEPDGLPNRLNRPLTTIKYNIWYHLGLAYYLKGNFDQAISAYKKCLEVGDNDDLIVAASTWLYRTYVKIGNVDEAMAILEPISRNMKLIKNRSYLNILMLFKNEVTPQRIYELAIRRDNTLDPTIGYGLGNWYVLQGEVETAKATFDQVIASNSWDSFGFIASEVERYNLTSSPL